MSEQNNNKQNTAKTSSRVFKAGSYSIISCVVLAVILIVVNMISNRLPANMTKYDITNTQLFTISDESKEIAKAVDKYITVYLIAETGSENNTIVELLNRYTGLNDKIRVQYVDPAVYPNFTKQYTSDELKENSLIFTGNGRNRIVSYDDIFEYDLTDYYTYGTIKTTFNGEGCVTGALDYICRAELPVIYNLTGHGEAQLTDTWKGYIEGQNTSLEDVNLLTDSTDLSLANAIIINAPTADYTKTEIEEITEYLQNGGSMLIVTNWSKDGQPNLMGLMQYYGCEYVGGIVIEGDNNYCVSGYQHYLIPDIKPHDITNSHIKNHTYVLVPMPHGIVESNSRRNTIEITSLLDSSESAYAKVAGNEMSTLTKEDGDIEGPFSLGVAIEENYYGTNTKIVWFPSSYLLDESMDKIVSGGNSSLILSSLSWMVGNTQTILSVTKNVGVESLIMTSSTKTTLTIVFAVAVPVVFVLVGFFIWLRRRKK